MKMLNLSFPRTGSLPHRKYSWLSRPEPKWGRKDCVNDTIDNRTLGLQACSAMPQPTAPLRSAVRVNFPSIPKW